MNIMKSKKNANYKFVCLSFRVKVNCSRCLGIWIDLALQSCHAIQQRD